MTLKAIADELNTTTMTIYRRLEKKSINIGELRDADTGEITPAGAAVIASLFKNTGTTDDNDRVKQIITDVLTGDAQAATGEAAQQTPGSSGTEAAQVAALMATVDGLRALVAQLEGERDELRRQLSQVTAALQAEQADRQQERRALTAGTGESTGSAQDQQRRGWFSRLFHGERAARGHDQKPGPSPWPGSTAPRDAAAWSRWPAARGALDRSRGDVSRISGARWSTGDDGSRGRLHDSARGRHRPPDGDGGRGWPDDQPRQAGQPGSAQQRRGPSPWMASAPRATAAAEPARAASRPGPSPRSERPGDAAAWQRAGSVTPGRWIGAGARSMWPGSAAHGEAPATMQIKA